jgi:hypothetical protein
MHGTDGRTEVTKLIVAFSSFPNAPKNQTKRARVLGTAELMFYYFYV